MLQKVVDPDGWDVSPRTGIRQFIPLKIPAKEAMFYSECIKKRLATRCDPGPQRGRGVVTVLSTPQSSYLKDREGRDKTGNRQEGSPTTTSTTNFWIGH